MIFFRSVRSLGCTDGISFSECDGEIFKNIFIFHDRFQKARPYIWSNKQIE